MAVATVVAILLNWQVREMEIFKDKLPAGLSYALRPSRLEDAVVSAGIQLPVALHQQHKVWAIKAPALSASFYPPKSYLGGSGGRFSVKSCAVPSSERKTWQDFAEDVFLPALIAWIASIETLSADSVIRRAEQHFACEGTPVALAKRPLPLGFKGQRRRKRA